MKKSDDEIERLLVALLKMKIDNLMAFTESISCMSKSLPVNGNNHSMKRWGHEPCDIGVHCSAYADHPSPAIGDSVLSHVSDKIMSFSSVTTSRSSI